MSTLLRKIFGIVMLLVALGSVIIAIAGIRFSHQLINDFGTLIDENLSLVSQSLDTTEDALIVAKNTLTEIQEGVATTQNTMLDVSQTLTDTRPLLDQVGTVTAQQVPAGLEAIQATMPDLEQVAIAIDDTLTTLNNFRIDRSFLGIELQYDLGINYNPIVPFDVSVRRINNSLEGVPDELRALDSLLNTTNDHLKVVSQDMVLLSADLADINAELRLVSPVVDDYLRIIGTVNDNIRVTRANLNTQLDHVKTGLTFLMIWLALTQVAHLYLGLSLLAKKNNKPTTRFC